MDGLGAPAEYISRKNGVFKACFVSDKNVWKCGICRRGRLALLSSGYPKKASRCAVCGAAITKWEGGEVWGIVARK